MCPRDEALARTIAWQHTNPPATVDAAQAQFDYAAEDVLLAAPGHLP